MAFSREQGNCCISNAEEEREEREGSVLTINNLDPEHRQNRQK